MRQIFLFKYDKRTYSGSYMHKFRKRGGWSMDDRNMTLERLTEENRKLKEDREILLDTLVQMNRTLNRLIEEYVTGVKN